MVTYEPFRTNPLSDFREELQFEFPTLPSQLFDFYLVKNARYMAEEGNLIRRKMTIGLQRGVTRYRLDMPDETELVGILSMRQYEPCPTHVAHEVRRSFTAPPRTPLSRIESHYDEQEGVLTIDCPFAGKVEVIASVRPVAKACELPHEFFDDYLDTLLMGTRGSILIIPGRPWSNMKVGAAYRTEFESMIAQKAIALSTHKQRGAVRMKFGRAM